MEPRMLIVLLCICSIIAVDLAFCNPCAQQAELPRAKYRGGNCTLTLDKPVSDRNLDPGWYRATGVDGRFLEIATQPPASPGYCGTSIPIWMNGTHPTVTDGIVNRTVCYFTAISQCAQEVEIQVSNCTDFYVYYLTDTETNQGYCFGQNDPCPPFDPCDIYEHELLEDSAGRSTECETISAPSNDSLLVSNWYLFESEDMTHKIPNFCPEYRRCGTEFPVWINGSIPSSEQDIIEAQACVRSMDNCCYRSFTIQVKNCSRFLVYNLTRTESNERYCTDEVVECPTSTTLTNTGAVEQTTRTTATMNDTVEQTTRITISMTSTIEQTTRTTETVTVDTTIGSSASINSARAIVSFAVYLLFFLLCQD